MATRSTAEESADVLHLYRLGDLGKRRRVAAPSSRVTRAAARPGIAWRASRAPGPPRRGEADYRRAVDALAEPRRRTTTSRCCCSGAATSTGALAHYRRAVALGLQHALLHSNLGCCCARARQLQESARSSSARWLSNPSLAHAHIPGVTLALQGGGADPRLGIGERGRARAAPPAPRGGAAARLARRAQ